jgi:hypothetical protein
LAHGGYSHQLAARGGKAQRRPTKLLQNYVESEAVTAKAKNNDEFKDILILW